MQLTANSVYTRYAYKHLLQYYNYHFKQTNFILFILYLILQNDGYKKLLHGDTVRKQKKSY